MISLDEYLITFVDENH